MFNAHIKQKALALVLSLMLGISNLFAQWADTRSALGVGVIIGDPTGISLKYWKSAEQAYQFGGAWSFVGEGAVHLYGDFLLHYTHVIQQAPVGFRTYLGLGGRMKFARLFRAGFRIPLGLSYQFPNAPLDFFLEVVPIMDIIPETRLQLNGGFGIRYYFLLRGDS